MAKAHITKSNGTKVTIEGSEREVANIIKLLEISHEGKAEKTKKNVRKVSNSKPTPASLICDLIDGGFFKKPKGLAAIRLALEEQGHFYPVTTLSPALLRLVRKKELRRIKENKRWLYVN